MHIAAHHRLADSQLSSRSLETSSGGAAGWLASAYRRWQQRNTERRELALMDERALRDARLSRWDVQQELARPFWRG